MSNQRKPSAGVEGQCQSNMDRSFAVNDGFARAAGTKGPINHSRRLCLLSALLVLSTGALLLNACKMDGHGSAAGDDDVDLTDRFVPIDGMKQSENVNRHASVVRNGLRKDALALVAPVTVRAAFKGVAGKRILKGWVAPVFNIGDGIQMDLYLSRGGDRRLIGSRYFNSGRVYADRAWIPISFPVELQESDQLEMVISAGPQGDLVADWLAFSDLRLVKG